MIEKLPIFQNVFFVHYQCDDFNQGTSIHSLCIFSKGKAKEYNGPDERENIELYCRHVEALCAEGLIPIHWNQNRSFYGPDHICSRYKEITGTNIELDYPNEIHLASLLIDIYGDDYAPHSRLDSLAEMNQCNGNSKTEYRQRTFAVNRVLLLSKIYHRLLHGKLVTAVNTTPAAALPPTPEAAKTGSPLTKEFPSYLLHARQEKLAEVLKTEFVTEKGKSLRLMLAALEQNTPALIVISNRQGKEVFNAMKAYFNRDIGAYQSTIGYKIQKGIDDQDIASMKVRINHLLEKVQNG